MPLESRRYLSDSGERWSRFQVEIENGVRYAAAAFRDHDPEASVSAVVRLWWTSRLHVRRFAQFVRQARDVTQERISLSVVVRGEPGVPTFFEGKPPLRSFVAFVSAA